MSQRTNQIKAIIGWIVFLIILVRFFANFDRSGKSRIYEEEPTVNSDTFNNYLGALFSDDLNLPADSISVLHKRSWKTEGISSYNQMSYESNLRSAKLESLHKKEYVEKKASIEYAQTRNYESTFKTIYGELYKYHPKALQHIADSLSEIAIKKNLDQVGFANLVVSYIQDMPYWFIVDGNKCGTGKYTGHPCIDNIPFGVLSPQEVGFAAFGDCDSKALYAYTLLRLLNYEPLIVISMQYEHAMLALNIPAYGDYVSYKGKPFYFWEVTNTGWQAGMVPPSVFNKAYWKIALTYEY